MERKSLQLQRMFPDEAACAGYSRCAWGQSCWALRAKAHTFANRQTSVTAGTMSKLDWVWFWAI